MNVLVVEDDRKIADVVRKGLQEEGFAVSVCRNGDEGYLMARHGEFDALVLDIMLPGRDGLSILRNLREQKIRYRSFWSLPARSLMSGLKV